MRWFLAARSFAGTGQLWPVLALLLLAVLVPTGYGLWFLNQAMYNEDAAVRLRLTKAYESQVQSAALTLEQHWRLQEEALAREGRERPPAARFAALVQRGACEAAILLDAAGRPAYPEPPDATVTSRPAPPTAPWRGAEKAEFVDKDWRAAARLYESIARRASDADEAAQAWQASARCLLKRGDVTRARHILSSVLAASRFRTARDAHGRWIAVNALLLALERTPDRSSPERRAIADELEARLLEYDVVTLPASQRRFLWTQLRSAEPDRPRPALATAEELAASMLQRGLPPAGHGLVPSGIPGLWAAASTDRRVVALFREERLIRELAAQLARQTQNPEARWQVTVPGASLPSTETAWTRRLDAPLRDWQIALHLDETDPFAAAARPRRTLMLWNASLALISIVLLTMLAGQAVSRQMRSTRLKDDLIATVSHELKTPLSSMRVLVDTLLAGAIRDPQQTREYLEIIAGENERLSGLIENFLTFSRMDRGRHTFDFSRVAVSDVVTRTLASIGDRLRAPGCRFEMTLAPDLPAVHADRDAMVTVLLNLLDNALKYSGAEKVITLRGYARGRRVYLEVEDNGVGFSRRVGRRIFERFFQAHRSLAGRAAGVGLGLSIVRSIVTAHHGTIDVASQAGKGSRFTVGLPAAGA